MMNQGFSQFILFVVSCAFTQDALSLKLESDNSFPTVGGNLILSCLTREIFNAGMIFWYDPKGTELSKCFPMKGGVCDRNTSRYSFTANISGAYAYIDGLDRTRDGGTWKCVQFDSRNHKEILTMENVIYTSPSAVKLVQPIPRDGDLGIESITLKCQTIGCAFPAPKITWYYKTDGRIAPFSGFSNNTVTDTSQCPQKEAMYTSTLHLPRGTNFSGNIALTTKILCGVTHQSLGEEIRYSKVSNDVIFAVHVSMVNLVDLESGKKVYYEGFPQTLKCVSSPSRPVPIIQWFLQTNNATNQATFITNNITEMNTTDSNGLHVRESEVTIIPKRDQIYKIFCAGNIDGQQPVKSTIVEIDVLYQADQPYVSELGRKFPWLENQTGNLSCMTSNYGNPASQVTWSSHRGTNGTNLIIARLTPNDNGKLVSCQLVNKYTVDKNTTVKSPPVSLNIEYSPVIELNITSPLTVNETQSISVLCSATGNPRPDAPKWTGQSGSTLRFENISRNDEGTYTCSVRAKSEMNGILESQKQIHILVQYAPEINVTITGSAQLNMTSNITCDASGFPTKYTFHPWKHMLGEMTIRSHLQNNHEGIINSSKNILTLNRLSLQDMGTYVCSVDNGVRGVNGNFIQTSSAFLNVKGMPEVVNRKNDTFAGETGSSVDMYVAFYGDPAITDFKFQRNGSNVKNTSRTIMYLRRNVVELQFHSTKVNLEVWMAHLLIQNLTKDDFGDYNLVLENSLGKTDFKLQLQSSGPPCMVTTFYYNRFIEGGIEFHFDPGFNGGRKQTFVVEYISMTSLVWTNTSITDLREEQTEYRLPNGTYCVNVTKPSPGNYIYRIYSKNNIGRSPYSMNASVFIPQDKNNFHANPLVEAAAGSIATTMVVILAVAATRVLVKKGTFSTKKPRGAYQSRRPTHSLREDIGTVYENMPVLNANVNADNEYENALAVRQFGVDVHDGDENVYENRNDVDMSLLRSNGNLIYADLELANPTANNGKPKIHGLENRTEYAEIAFDRRGEPLPDSDDGKESPGTH